MANVLRLLFVTLGYQDKSDATLTKGLTDAEFKLLTVGWGNCCEAHDPDRLWEALSLKGATSHTLVISHDEWSH